MGMDLRDLANLKRQIQSQGYSKVSHLSPGVSSEQVAAVIGTPIEPWSGAVVQHLKPRLRSTPNTYSGIFGTGMFPLHTDLAHWPIPPRYLLLRCVKGYAEVPTLLLDGMAMAAAVGVDALARAVVIPRRPFAGKMRLHRLFARQGCDVVIRWDEVFLKPASKVGEQVFDQVRAVIAEMPLESAALISEGDTLILDNWRMLHARPLVPMSCQDRHIERVYLEKIA